MILCSYSNLDPVGLYWCKSRKDLQSKKVQDYTTCTVNCVYDNIPIHTYIYIDTHTHTPVNRDSVLKTLVCAPFVNVMTVVNYKVTHLSLHPVTLGSCLSFLMFLEGAANSRVLKLRNK